MLELNKNAVIPAVRTTVAALAPLIIGRLVGQPYLGFMIALGGLNISTADPGGPYQVKALTMGMTTFGIALAGLAGTLSSGLHWLAVPLVFLWTFGSSLLGGYGPITSKVSFAMTIVFLVTLNLPAGLPGAFLRFGAFIAGGLWAMALTLWIWPIQPYRPVLASLGEYYRALAAFLNEVSRNEKEPERVEDFTEKTPLMQKREAAEKARNQIRDYLIGFITFRIGGRPATHYLEDLALTGDIIFDATIQLNRELRLAARQEVYEQFRSEIEQVIEQLTAGLNSLAGAIERRDAPGDLEALETATGTLSRKIIGLRDSSYSQPNGYATYLNLANLSRTISSLAGGLQKAIGSARKPGKPDSDHPDDISSKAGLPGTGEILERMRDNFSFNSTVFRHALRLGITSAIGVAVYTLFGLQHGFWITLTIAVVLKPDFGGTVQRAYRRVIGTVAGGILGAVLAATVHSDLEIYLLLGILGVLAYTQLGGNYTIFVIFLTPFVVLLIDLSSPGDWQIASLRIINTAIGGALALIAIYLFWPYWQRRRIVEQLADTIAANRDFLCAVLNTYLGQNSDPAAVRNGRDNARTETANAENAFQQLLDEPKQQQGNPGPVFNMLTHTRRLCDGITALAAHLSHYSGNHRLDGLEQFTARIYEALNRLEEAIRQGQPSGPVPRLEENLQEIKAELDALIARRVAELDAGQTSTPTRQTLIDFAPLGRDLERLTREISGLNRELTELARQS